MIPSISQSGLTGIQRGLQQVTNAANSIVTADRDINVADLAMNTIELVQGEKQVEVSVMSLKIDDQLKGTLFDTKV